MKLHHRTIGKFSAVFCVLLLTLTLAVGVTQARYNNATSWTGYYDPVVQQLSSDVLKPEGQTVILQPWEATPGAARTQEIRLMTNKEAAYVTLQCSTDSPYIAASLDQSGLYASDTGETVKLQLTVTDEAQYLTQITTARVSVTMKSYDQTQTLRAHYQITLLPSGMTLPDVKDSELEANLTITPDQAERTFAWQEKLVFTVLADSNADSVELMFNGDVFPKGTRYCVEREWYVLADDMTIRVPVTAGTAKPIALDFSQTTTNPQQIIHITAVAYLGNEITDQMDFAVRATRVPLEIGEMTTDPVIRHSGSITVPITGDEEGLVLLVQQLKRTDSGSMYVQSDALSVQLKPDGANEGNYLLEISNKTGKAPAGTYRITLIRMCDNQIVSTCQMVFFVHY